MEKNMKLESWSISGLMVKGQELQKEFIVMD